MKVKRPELNIILPVIYFCVLWVACVYGRFRPKIVHFRWVSSITPGSKRKSVYFQGGSIYLRTFGGFYDWAPHEENARVYFQVVVNGQVVLSVGSSSKKLYFWGCSAKMPLPLWEVVCFWWVLSQNRALLSSCLLKLCTSRGLKTVPFWVVATENLALPRVSSFHFEVT